MKREGIVNLLNTYYENNAKKLHFVVDQIFNRHYGGTNGKDMEEFYGVATDVLIEIWEKENYDSSKGDFNGYVYNALRMALIDEFKKRDCDKRVAKVFLLDENGNKILDEKTNKPKKIPISDVYLDTPIKDGENLTYYDMLKSDFDMDIEISKRMFDYSDNINEYLDSLSKLQKKIAMLIMEGYKRGDIIGLLNITDKQYKECWSVMTSYEKKRVLYKENNNNMEDKVMNDMAIENNVTEKFKDTSYSISSISKQLKKRKIRDDHILQRHSGQWKSFAKSELISDILRGKSLTQIIISEEIKNGIQMQWLIDGKQRCTTLDDFLHDGFAISRNIKNYNVRYQAPKTENGEEVYNEEGFPDMEWKDFDIRGKKYSQLPEELQDIFKDRQIPVLFNMNCTKMDIAEDIARFNRSRPMNKAQNGWLELDENFAEIANKIAMMDFFKPEFPGSAYTNNNNTSGQIRRIIIESIMVSDFIDNYSSDFNKMCEFLSEEGTDSNFSSFYSLVERLTDICKTSSAAELFDSKDSFLWFGLFSRFSKFNLEDDKFVKFMEDFKELRKKKYGKESFDDILERTKSTKDKGIVVKKLNYLEIMLKEYLGIQEENGEENNLE